MAWPIQPSLGRHSHDCLHGPLLDGVGLDFVHGQSPGSQTHTDSLIQDFTAHTW